MNLFAKYLKEKDGIEYLEIKDKAFCTFIIQSDSIYIVDIYVIPKFRKGQVASKLADRVAEVGKNLGKKFLLGAVEKGSKAEETNKKVLTGYGFEFSHYNEEDEINYYIKVL